MTNRDCRVLCITKATRQQQVMVYIAQQQIQFPGSKAWITTESLLSKQTNTLQFSSKHTEYSDHDLDFNKAHPLYIFKKETPKNNPESSEGCYFAFLRCNQNSEPITGAVK